jgi:hypothetical protein
MFGGGTSAYEQRSAPRFPEVLVGMQGQLKSGSTVEVSVNSSETDMLNSLLCK